MMNAEEAKELGYELEAASPIEVGLIYKGQGLRTWWASRFGGKMPSLDHPDVMAAIGMWEDSKRIKFAAGEAEQRGGKTPEKDNELKKQETVRNS